MSRDQGAVNRNGTEKSYIRHAKGRKKREHNFARYDATTREIIFEVIEAVIESNRNSKDGFGARTLFGHHVQSIMDVFMALDSNQNGVLDTREFSRGMHRLGIGLTKEQIEKLINFMDSDNSGRIEYTEFKMFEDAEVEHARRKKMLKNHSKDSTTASHVVNLHSKEQRAAREEHLKKVQARSGLISNDQPQQRKRPLLSDQLQVPMQVAEARVPRAMTGPQMRGGISPSAQSQATVRQHTRRQFLIQNCSLRMMIPSSRRRSARCRLFRAGRWQACEQG